MKSKILPEGRDYLIRSAFILLLMSPNVERWHNFLSGFRVLTCLSVFLSADLSSLTFWESVMRFGVVSRVCEVMYEALGGINWIQGASK